MKVSLLLVSIILFSISYLEAQEDKLVSFFNTLIDDNFNVGIEDLLLGSTFKETEGGIDEINKIKEIFNAIKINYGNVEEFEKYSEIIINDRIKIYEYFTYHKYSLFYWKFILYKSGPNWIQTNLELSYDMDNIPMKKYKLL